jgi:sugar phosphate isomerase/epimerase
MTTLSLDCLTLTDTSPVELIRSAGAAGFDLVSLWVQPPSAFPSALATPAQAAELARALADSGVAVHSLEPFELASPAAIESYRPALELGARLGGKAALAYHSSVSDRGQAAELLALLARTAAEYGLGVNLEPVAMGETRRLTEARDLIRASGADVGILFDTWHLVRSGCGIDELKAIEPGLICYVQINDGLVADPPADQLAEVMGERLYPGEGEFPLVELLRATPRDIPWAIETPSLRRANSGVTAQEQAKEAMSVLQRLLSRIDELPRPH